MNQNLIQQLSQAKNKEAFMMSIIPPEQLQAFKQFQSMDAQQQAQKIADYCNVKGITKEELKKRLGIN